MCTSSNSFDGMILLQVIFLFLRLFESHDPLYHTYPFDDLLRTHSENPNLPLISSACVDMGLKMICPTVYV